MEKDRMQNPEVPHPKLTKRSVWLFSIAIALFSLLLLRILYLQTFRYEYYQQKVIDQMTTETEVTAARGGIYDQSGTLLATNVTTYRVFLSPSSLARQQAELKANGSADQLDELVAKRLSTILDVSYEFVLRQTTYTKYLDRTIKKEVSEEDADRVRKFIADYSLQQVVYLQTTSTRFYPYSTLACHVLGFIGSDGNGLYGLEYSYNEYLSGKSGKYITARDARGNEMPYEYKEYISEENGCDLHTTLDIFVQSTLEEEVKSAYLEANGQNRAAGIVMNVNTGAILGMAVYPNFDANDPWTLDAQSEEKLQDSGHTKDSDEYSALKQAFLQSMWSNKAVTESYIPGSTFKVLTASMALEEAVVTESDGFHCSGSYTVLGQRIHCHKTSGHGSLTFEEGIQQSCNPVLMQVGLRLGTSKFYSYLRAFGYRDKTGIDLPGEGNGIFIGENDFTDLDLAIYSFGQNFNVTLIQQITAISAVANGGYLVTPHLVSSITDRDGNLIKSFDTNVKRQVVSAETCKRVAKILEEGVSGSGGAKNAYVAGYRIAAKTGTSEKKNAGSEGRYVCSTVAFAPADNPQYAVIIIVDEPTAGVLYGSTVAAPYVGNVMATILPYLGVEAVYSEKELKNLAVTIPSCIGWSVSAATKMLGGSSYGVAVKVVGDPDGVVRRQYPEAGTVIEKSGGCVILYTDKATEVETVTVPNVVGMSAQAANQTIVNAGLNIRIKGTKNYLSGTGCVAVSQSVEAGTPLAKGSVVEVTFRYLDAVD